MFVCPMGLVMRREEREGQSCDQPVCSPCPSNPPQRCSTEVLPVRVSIILTGVAPRQGCRPLEVGQCAALYASAL
jgi:hypothetical protein